MIRILYISLSLSLLVYIAMIKISLIIIYFVIFILGLLHGNARPMSVLLKDLRLYQVACVYMSARAFINLSQIYVPLYLHKSLNMPATSLAVIPLIIFLSSFVIPLIKAKLRPKICKKCSFRIGVLLSICACIWIQFGRDITYTSSQIYCIAMILGKIM